MLLVFVLFLAGVLLQPFQVALVQYLEGYWDRGPARPFGTIAMEGHRRRLRTAQVERDVEAPGSAGTTFRTAADSARAQALAARVSRRATFVVMRYPVEIDRVMPTMLGNILRNGEDAAGDRYGLGAMTFYPRMYPSVSKPLSDAMARQLDMIALTASLCVSFAVGAVATSPILVRLDLWSMIPVVSALLSAVSYRGALRAASDHGTLFATCFDLHRFDMVRALHHSLPTTFAEEREINSDLTRFLQGRQQPDGRLAARSYDHSIYDEPPPAAAPSASESGGENTRSNSNTGEADTATPPPDEPAERPPPTDPSR